MTGLASRSRRYMVRRFTFGSCTVMAAGTACGDASVIHFATYKAGGGAMACFASCSGCDVVSRFAFGCCTVMAAGTASCDASMIHFSTSETGSRAVTGLAGRSRR